MDVDSAALEQLWGTIQLNLNRILNKVFNRVFLYRVVALLKLKNLLKILLEFNWIAPLAYRGRMPATSAWGRGRTRAPSAPARRSRSPAARGSSYWNVKKILVPFVLSTTNAMTRWTGNFNHPSSNLNFGWSWVSRPELHAICLVWDTVEFFISTHHVLKNTNTDKGHTKMWYSPIPQCPITDILRVLSSHPFQ